MAISTLPLLLCCVWLLALTINAAIHPLAATTDIDYANWMGSLPQAVKDGPFKNIILPGSHDSATYQLQYNATPPMQNDVFQILLDLALNPLTGLIADEPIRELTITHRGPIAPYQFSVGIRAIDLRVLYNADNAAQGLDPFYFSHSFAAVPVNETLQAMATFVEAHPTEVFVVQLDVDWEHRNQTMTYLPHVARIVQAYLGQWMVPRPTTNDAAHTYFQQTSLSALQAANHRVFLSIVESSFDVQPFTNVWPASMINQFWPNGQTMDQSVSRIDAYLAAPNSTNVNATMPDDNEDQLNLIFFTITPSDASIIENVLAHLNNLTDVTSLHDYAIVMRPPTLSILKRAVGVERRRISVVSMDWPIAEVIGEIVALNQ